MTQTTKQTHTPGPWNYMPPLGEGLPAVLAEQVTSFGNFYVAQCNVDADARLIAATPDLLEACKAMLEYDSHENREKARAAIAKAEGKS